MCMLRVFRRVHSWLLRESYLYIYIYIYRERDSRPHHCSARQVLRIDHMKPSQPKKHTRQMHVTDVFLFPSILPAVDFKTNHMDLHPSETMHPFGIPTRSEELARWTPHLVGHWSGQLLEAAGR